MYASGDRTRLKLLLERLEESYGHKETVPFDSLTIEHVLPQALTTSWREVLGQQADEDHEVWVHTLGNLTLTGYNPELSNSDFDVKKQLLAESHVELNRYFADIEVWDRTAIEQRAKVLAERARAIWPNFAGEDAGPSRAPGDVTGTKPRVLKIAGKSIRVGTWADVLRETMRELVELDDDLPQRLQATLPNWCGTRPDIMRNPLQIAPGVFFDVHASASGVAKRCKDVVRESGLDIEWQVETA